MTPQGTGRQAIENLPEDDDRRRGALLSAAAAAQTVTLNVASFPDLDRGIKLAIPLYTAPRTSRSS